MAQSSFIFSRGVARLPAYGHHSLAHLSDPGAIGFQADKPSHYYQPQLEFAPELRWSMESSFP